MHMKIIVHNSMLGKKLDTVINYINGETIFQVLKKLY